jgi:hypothetical protein
MSFADLWHAETIQNPPESAIETRRQGQIAVFEFSSFKRGVFK